jgi:hydroxymethylbilane synthase
MRIGTRGSALALVQARIIAERLDPEAEIVTVTTSGDRGEVSDKSRWTTELERALLDGRIDIAVHSAKDLATEMPDGLELVAVAPRADPHDAICGAPSLAALPPGARIGTSSLRRAAQIHSVRADVQVLTLRGNVDTRLRKLAKGQVDAIVIALAGLQRLGRDGEAGGVLAELVPAAGQGAIAVQARPGALDAQALERITDADAFACVSAERALVHALGASCNTPVGANARTLGDGRLELVGWVGLPDGSAWLSDKVQGDVDTLGARCAERMLAAGAAELLREAERESVA